MVNRVNKKFLELTTLQITKGLRERVREQADDRGMRMAPFAEELVSKALGDLSLGFITIPTPSVNGGKIRKSNQSANNKQIRTGAR